MTLAVAWVREVGTGPELVFAADSRLRQGGAWDSCPKIFRLPRSDAVMAFAGETLWAYPIVLQTINDIDAFPPSRRRQSDLRVARGHALRVLNQMMTSGDAVSGGLHEPDTEFLFGGWSWEAQKFLLWRFHWSTNDHGFRHETQRPQRWGTVRFIGDRNKEDPERDLVGVAKQKLYALLDERGRVDGPLDMEPFEVLVEMLRSRSYETLGGPAQLLKVYRHMNAQFFGVAWPSAAGPVTLAGRQLLEYEELDIPVLDPDSPTMLRPIEPIQRPEGFDGLLLAALEELGTATPAHLVAWSDEHRYDFKAEEVDAWLVDARRRGLIVQTDAFHVTLSSPPSESND
jgi:hypothetical protein